MNLTGKTLVVIGGAGLLGKQFVKTLINADANVVVADYNIEAAAEVCNALISEGVKSSTLMAVSVNIVDKESLQKLIEDSINRFGCISGVVNTAYPRNANYGKKFEDVEFKDFCENTNLNLGGYFLTSQVFEIGRASFRERV